MAEALRFTPTRAKPRIERLLKHAPLKSSSLSTRIRTSQSSLSAPALPKLRGMTAERWKSNPNAHVIELMRDYDMKISCLWASKPTPLEQLLHILSSRGIEEYTIIFDWCIEAEGKYYLVVDELNDEETSQRHEILRIYIEKKVLESQVAVSAFSPSRELVKI
jgi:hypothetical protein